MLLETSCNKSTLFKSTITLLYLFIFIEYIVQHATTKIVPAYTSHVAKLTQVKSWENVIVFCELKCFCDAARVSDSLSSFFISAWFSARWSSC